MKKVALIIFGTALSLAILFVAGNFLSGFFDINTRQIPKQTMPFKTQIEQDFDYVFDIIKNDYPYTEALKQYTGYDFLADYDKHKAHVMQAKNKTEFFFLMDDVLKKLNNQHTHMMTKADVEYGIGIYSQSRHDDYRWQIYTDLTRDPILKQNYATEIGLTKEQEAELRKQKIAEHDAKLQSDQPPPSLSFSVIDDKLAYLRVPEMTHYSQLYDEDVSTLMGYLTTAKNYPVLIIDIRGNEGGDTRYWTNFLLPRIIKQPYSLKLLSFYKNGPHIKAYTKDKELKPINLDEIKRIIPVSNTLADILTNFEGYLTQDIQVNPSPQSIHFNGKIYLLVDHQVYSSAETLAIFAKNTHFATLIGEQTGGDGIGTDPMIVILPNTHFAMRFSKQLGVDPEGNINEFHPTMPNYVVKHTSGSAKHTRLVDDPAIKKAIELSGF